MREKKGRMKKKRWQKGRDRKNPEEEKNISLFLTVVLLPGEEPLGFNAEDLLAEDAGDADHGPAAVGLLGLDVPIKILDFLDFGREKGESENRGRGRKSKKEKLFRVEQGKKPQPSVFFHRSSFGSQSLALFLLCASFFVTTEETRTRTT